jgi:D-sedoheptulose 7-phosphate isomerase
MSFSESYLEETGRIVGQLDPDSIERLATGLAEVRDAGGRLFVLGVGGSAAHAGHAVNDFRKLCGFETYAPTDNVSELTARVNDDGWDSAYVEWLRGSRLGSGDAVLALSVGGGSVAKNLSANLVAAMDHARQVGARVFAIVGRDGGYAREISDACVVIPPLVPEHVTPHTEGLASVICHLLVSHPALQQSAPVWESRG